MLKRITLLSVLLVACIALAAMAAHHRHSEHTTVQATLPAGVTHKVLTDKPSFKSGVYTVGDGGLIVTTVQKSLSQNFATFPTLSTSFTGSQAPVVDFSLSSGSTQTLPDALGNVQVANLQMLTIWTDNLDVSVLCNSTTAYGSSSGTLAVKQGTPYEWDFQTSGGSATLPFTDWKSLSVTAGTSGTLSGGTAANTGCHIRASLSK